MELYKNTQIIVCLGDESRHTFARNICGNEIEYEINLMNSGYLLLHGELEKVVDEDGWLKIYSRRIAIGRVVCLPNNTDSMLDSNDRIRFDKIIWFNTFPYGKRNIIADVEEFCSKNQHTDIAVVLYREERRFGYNDLGTEEDSVEEALEAYRSITPNVMVYNDLNQTNELLKVKKSYKEYLNQYYVQEFQMSYHSFQMDYDLNYEFEIQQVANELFGLLNPNEFKRFLDLFSFRNMRGKKDLWKEYCDLFTQRYLKSGYQLVNVISEFYMGFVREIIVNSEEEEKIRIQRELMNQFKLTFAAPFHKKIPVYELEYIKLINETSIIAEFQIRLKQFFSNDVKELVKDALTKKYIQIAKDIKVEI